MINAAKKRGKRSGGDLEKPVCLTLAPTGVAAYLVNGTTIESGLGIQPTRDRTYLRNNASRNSSLRFLYEDLQCIFLDEVSMCGSDMLAKMNFRMQEIMGNTDFMGGVSVVCTGDFGQLPPVGQKMIWETSYLDNRVDISPNHWNENFKIYYLTQKMRSQDEEFSNICDNVRKGICDDKVTDYLKHHIGKCPSENDNTKYAEGKFSIIVTTNAAREEINNEKLEKLLPEKKKYFANALDKSTNNPNAPELSDKLPLTRTGQLQKTIVFKEGAPVMITSNHQKSKYKNNGFVNGARGYIDSIQASKDDPDLAEVIWVRFTDDKIGQLLRLDSKALLKHHKPNDPLAVPICRQKKQFQARGNTEYMRDQFPLTLCYAVTAHKSQGQTLEEVLIDFSGESRINNGSFYTAISRVKYGVNLYLKDFKPSYIKANPDVEKKMQAMKLFKSYNFTKVCNTEKIFVEDGNEIKLGYININDIMTAKSVEFLNEDKNLLALDFLVVADTRLNHETEVAIIDQNLSNWHLEARFDSTDNVKHMGMLLLKSNSCKIENCTYSIKNYTKKDCLQMQVLFVKFPEFRMTSSFVYLRVTPTKDQVKILKRDLTDIDLVMGDFNLDLNKSEHSEKLEFLCLERKQVLNEVTTAWFNQLDHVLLNSSKFKIYFSTSFINYTSDHHVITARIALLGNQFDDNFLKKMSFNVDIETRKAKKMKLEKETKTHIRTPYDGDDHEKSEKQEAQKEGRSEDNLYNTEEHSSNINLSCLFSPNWLNDEVIDNYLNLLKTIDDRNFMFTTYFYKTFSQRGFEGVKNYYQRFDLLSYRTIFIPVHHGSHWFLITFNGKELVSFDSYNYAGTSGKKRDEFLKENLKFHTDILKNLQENYFRPLYKLYGKTFANISVTVKLPPSIPAQDNSFDCGVFLLSIAKYLVFERNFDFCTEDMINIRNIIRNELEANLIMRIETDLTNLRNSQKRNPNDSPKKRKKKMKQNFAGAQRRILNPDAATCWLNSCLQLVLTALDFKTNLCETGSVLWNHLLWMRGKDPSITLDPTEIKNLIIQTEKNRIVLAQKAPKYTLFDLGNLPINYERGVKGNNFEIGQQDCKDFFYCLDENQFEWPDVFMLLKVNTQDMTQCRSCFYISKQEFSTNERTFISITCPNSDSDICMKNYIEDKMNGYELIEGWRDEDGCREETSGMLSTRISDIDDTECILFVLERLTRVGGRLTINRTKVIVDGHQEIKLLDINGKSALFSPIAIIHHTGNVRGETTSGHYRADVKNKVTNSWFRTSDNELPTELSANRLTQMGYIFLYKKQDTKIEQN